MSCPSIVYSHFVTQHFVFRHCRVVGFFSSRDFDLCDVSCPSLHMLANSWQQLPLEVLDKNLRPRVVFESTILSSSVWVILFYMWIPHNTLRFEWRIESLYLSPSLSGNSYIYIYVSFSICLTCGPSFGWPRDIWWCVAGVGSVCQCTQVENVCVQLYYISSWDKGQCLVTCLSNHTMLKAMSTFHVKGGEASPCVFCGGSLSAIRKIEVNNFVLLVKLPPSFDLCTIFFFFF